MLRKFASEMDSHVARPIRQCPDAVSVRLMLGPVSSAWAQDPDAMHENVYEPCKNRCLDQMNN